MTTPHQMVFVGIRGVVLALDRSTGNELWRVGLKGSDFVNLTLDGDQLLATARGEIFCLDALTGAVRWQNNLTGLGLGLLSVVTASSPGSLIGPEAEARKRQQAEDGATAAMVATM